MKKNVLFIFVILSLATKLQAQCENINLTTQAQVDSFAVDYPNCTQVTGDLIIDGDDINNLIPLQNIISVENLLAIKNTVNLSSLVGLENITSVGHAVEIMNNQSLISLTGLNNLTSVNLLEIKNNPTKNLEGLESLEEVGGNFIIQDNDSLINLIGCSNLQKIAGEFYIKSNPILKDLAGLGVLDSIGALVLRENDDIRAFDGLESIKWIGGDLTLIYNSALMDISALDYTIPILGNLTILENSNLWFCQVKAICDYMAAPAGIISIANNHSSCISEQGILTSCGLTSIEDPLLSGITIFPNPTTQLIQLEGLEGLNTDLRLINTLGEVLLEKQNYDGASIDLENFPNGVYFIEISVDQERRAYKLMKTKD